MTPTDRKISTQSILDECIGIMKLKEVDYASKEDTNANFKRIAERLGLSKYQVWGVYFGKHADAISNAVKYHPDAPKTEDNSESLRGRIADAINYLTLLVNLMEEDAQTDTGGLSPLDKAAKDAGILPVYWSRPVYDDDFQPACPFEGDAAIEDGNTGDGGLPTTTEIAHVNLPWTRTQRKS